MELPEPMDADEIIQRYPDVAEGVTVDAVKRLGSTFDTMGGFMGFSARKRSR